MGELGSRVVDRSGQSSNLHSEMTIPARYTPAGMLPSARQVRAARGLLDWSQGDLSIRANVPRNSLNRFERGLTDTKLATVEAIRRTLENAGVEFMVGTKRRGEGVRLKKPSAE